MQRDELQTIWATHGALLERNTAINERVLRELTLRRVRVAMAPFVLMRALEVALGLAVLLAIASVLRAHMAELRYVVGGGAVLLVGAVGTCLCAYLFFRSLRIHFDAPVVELQRELEHLKLAEALTLEWMLLGGVLIWLPATLLLFESATGVDALTRVDASWFYANLGFGAVVWIVGRKTSQRFVHRSRTDRLGRRWIEAMSGHSLQVATRQLAELAKFSREN